MFQIHIVKNSFSVLSTNTLKDNVVQNFNSFPTTNDKNKGQTSVSYQRKPAYYSNILELRCFTGNKKKIHFNRLYSCLTRSSVVKLHWWGSQVENLANSCPGS